MIVLSIIYKKSISISSWRRNKVVEMGINYTQKMVDYDPQYSLIKENQYNNNQKGMINHVKNVKLIDLQKSSYLQSKNQFNRYGSIKNTINVRILMILLFFSVIIRQANSACTINEVSGVDVNSYNIWAMRMTFDSKRIVSLDYYGVLKLWTWDGTNFVLKQRWTCMDYYDQNFQGLFLWNNGAKLFVGGRIDDYTGPLQIYTYDNLSGNYIESSMIYVQLPSRIHSIAVNNNGTRIYCGTLNTLYVVNYIGSTLTFSVASFASTYRNIWNVFLTKDQKKLIFYSMGNSSICIFKLNSTTQAYYLDQTLTPVTGIGNIRLSEDQQFISAYGTTNSFVGFMLNTTTDRFFNVTVARSTSFTTNDVYVDNYRVLTISKKDLTGSNHGIQTYQFNYINGTPSYTFGMYLNLTNPRQLLNHIGSLFTFVHTDFKIYSVICGCGNSSNINCNSCIDLFPSCYFCSNGYALNEISGSCLTCTPGCVNCKDLTLLNCASCSGLYYKNYNSTICSLTCPNGQYIAINGLYPNQCQLCSFECTKCIDTNKKCLDYNSCITGYYFYSLNSSCLSVCPTGWYSYLTNCTQTCITGTYVNITSKSCKNCSTGCQTCFSSPTNCTTCLTVNSTVYYKNAITFVCSTTCPNGQFISLTIPNTCSNCSTQCTRCINSSNTCADVNACASNYYFYSLNSSCISQCPVGSYLNGLQCSLCDVSCYTCINSSTLCTACPTSQPNTPMFLYNNTCVSTCPAGSFLNNQTDTCDSCYIGCKTCYSSSANNCLTCFDVSLTVYYKNTETDVCSTSCPNGQVISSTLPNSCQKCSIQCTSCVNNPSTCTDMNSCANNFYYYSQNSSCLAQCPKGYFINGLQCVSCDNNCYQCANSSTFCTKCMANQQNSTTYLSQNTCVQICPTGQYASQSLNLCIVCFQGCATCTSQKQDNCLSCLNISSTVYFKNARADVCTTSCPDGELIQTSNSCQNCSQQCLKCVENPKKCFDLNSCASSFYFYALNSSCLSQCPNKHFINTKVCQPCDIKCQSCENASSLCTSCLTNQQNIITYLFINNTCLQTCPDGYYPIQSSHTCNACFQTCKTCQLQSTNCLTCKQNHFMFSLNTSCLAQCPDGYYIDGLNCSPCDVSCTKCINSSTTCLNNDSCYKDVSNSVIYYFYSPLGQNKCLLDCPVHSIKQDLSYSCLSCHQDCLDCTGSNQNQCSSCNQSSSRKILYLNNNSCLQTCPEGQYYDETLGQCNECSSPCAGCISNPTNCTKCDDLNSTTTYYLFNGTCINSCPPGYQLNFNTGKCDCNFYESDKITCLLAQCENDTFVDQATERTICKNCSLKLGTCPLNTAKVVLSSKIIKNGELMEHMLYFSQKLSSDITAKSLLSQIKFYVIDHTSNRLLSVGNSLSSRQLLIKSIRISSDRYYIFVQTQNSINQFDLLNGAVQAKFINDNMFGQNNIQYTLLSSEFLLNDPYFMRSYFYTYQYNPYTLLVGWMPCFIGLLMIALAIILNVQTAFHQIVGMMLFFQCLGLMRTIYYPMEAGLFTTLTGFSILEMDFFPNIIYQAMTFQYHKSPINSIEFAFGNTNLFNFIGNILLSFGCLEMFWIIVFAARYSKSTLSKRFSLSQKFIISVFMPKILFSSVLIIISLIKKSIQLKTFQSYIGLCLAIVLILGYIVYFILSVRPNLRYQLYKIQCILRIASIFVLIFGPFVGLIVINLFQSIPIIIDWIFFKRYKINRILYIIDRLMIIFIINSILVGKNTFNLKYALIFSTLVLICIKGFYIFKSYKNSQEQITNIDQIVGNDIKIQDSQNIVKRQNLYVINTKESTLQQNLSHLYQHKFSNSKPYQPIHNIKTQQSQISNQKLSFSFDRKTMENSTSNFQSQLVIPQILSNQKRITNKELIQKKNRYQEQSGLNKQQLYPPKSRQQLLSSPSPKVHKLNRRSNKQQPKQQKVLNRQSDLKIKVNQQNNSDQIIVDEEQIISIEQIQRF